MKKLILIPFIVAMVFCTAGCEQRSFSEMAVTYMTDKYGEEFTWLEPVGGQFGSNRHSGYVSCGLFPEEKILVEGEKNDGQYRMTDNFCEYYLADEIEKMIEICLHQSDIDCEVKWEPREASNIVPGGKEITPSEYLRLYGARISIYFDGEPDQKDKIMEKIQDAFTKQEFSADISVYFSNSEAAVESNPRGRFLLDKDGIYQIYKWK